MIHEHFKNLLIAVRFGNEAYYAGDLDRALANMQYEAAERVMIQFRNQRGRGVCLNNKGNKGNTLKHMGTRFNEALNMYNLAIQNGKFVTHSVSHRCN
ncbi:hypothetical protein BC938DRAFT_481626 [Jimgerdemannia flammicorona]|uniref:Uncharacterized protein n=1 Tax=Jimgerdemannia flammicorona TaxID=994334 RepID=A0A433QFQ4_9FUNG|nr:hypothetical protein BC938DRAFT_481626 [Jimgerdemannia flammicorona]